MRPLQRLPPGFRRESAFLFPDLLPPSSFLLPLNRKQTCLESQALGLQTWIPGPAPTGQG